ncbi:MAG: serine/threonine-protein kinase, partial [Gemmatimonadaceae bacterium]
MSDFRDELQASLDGQYVIEREVSSGSMAVVYQAQDLRHGRSVAIKALRPEYLGAVEGERFLREIRVVASLQHPHILPLFDSGEAAGGLYYVMPFVEGPTLRERLRSVGTLTPQSAVELAQEVCDALAYAHQHNVLHRDVKPENIMISTGHALVGDFGIARAIRAATKGQTTAAGIAVGTPAYMSPEQASGEHELTEQSDIYSLGCVVYEMLTGEAPHAATSNRTMLTARLTGPPRELLALRPDLQPALSVAVMKALSLDPKDRHQTAEQFSAALGAAIEESAPAKTRARRRWAIGTSLATALLLLVAFKSRVFGDGGASLDPEMFVVLPFADGDQSQRSELDGAAASRLVTDAVARWRGVRLADDMRVRDAVSRRGGKEFSLKEALAAARSLGAGRLIWGVVHESDGEVDVRLSVFNASASSAEPLARSRRVLGVGASVMDGVAAMTDEVMTRVAGGGVDAAPTGTRDAGALRSYLAAHAQLTSYNLDSATQLFERAGQLDSTFVRAFYWQAQTMAWRAEKRGESWEAPATRAIALGSALSPRERQLAAALLSLARREFATACTQYESLIAGDSLDFEAWFGKGECLMKDSLVVPDLASPSGWRFRSSAHSAVTAYERSLTLAPSFLAALGGTAISRLESLLLATPNDVSIGYAQADSLQFAAYPGLEGDTLSRIPWPANDLFSGKPGVRPRSYVAALDRNRELLRKVTALWVRQNPMVAGAHAHEALALENMAKIDTIGRSESALGEILAARALPHGRADSVRFMGTQLRLLVKLSRPEEAKALADSMLLFSGRVDGAEAKVLASAAMLTGRLRLATQFLRSWTREELLWTPRGLLPYPVSFADPAMELAVYASAGTSAEIVTPMIDRTERAIDALARAELAPSLRMAFLDIPTALAYPVTGVTHVHRTRHAESRYLGIEYALSRNDRKTAQAQLDTLAAETILDRPGDAGIEYVLIEAR